MSKRLIISFLWIFYCFNIFPALGETDPPVPIPIRDLMQDPLIDDVKISPDGRSIAALYNHNDRILVLINDLSVDNSEPILVNVLNHDVKSIDWASEERIIAGTVVEEGIRHDYYALVVMDKDGKNMRHLISDYSLGNLIDLMPDDPDHVLVEELNISNQVFPEVYKVSIGRKRREKLIQRSRTNVGNWITDANGEVKMGENVGLPEGFPKDVPVYENMNLHLAMSTGNGYALSGISQDSVAEITNWYKDKLKDWKIVNETTFETDEGKSINLSVTKGEMDMTIMIIDTEDGAGINQTLGE